MTQVQFAKLTELPLRDAWKHEALDFTPWLANNIDHLSDAIGIPLELTGTEVAVDSFSADILARNPMDDSVVLIENQLEQTDHSHLGQIMTYLAGLDAQTVVWIAPSFRDAHLSAIHWLNENTSDNFSFIAVKAKVVRIGDSPFAPIFEVIAKPDDWARSLNQTRRSASTTADPHSDTRLAYWTHYAERHPAAVYEDGLKPSRLWNSYFQVHRNKIQVSLWIGVKEAGIYICGGRGNNKFMARDILSSYQDRISDELKNEWFTGHNSGHVCGERVRLSYTNPESWDTLSDWMEERRTSYIKTLEGTLEGLQL